MWTRQQWYARRPNILASPPQRVHAVFVNGEEARLETPLHDGDQVRLFPPVVGGADRISRIVAMSFCEPRSWTRVLSS